MYTHEIDICLSPAEYIDSDHADVEAFSLETTAGLVTPSDRLRALYYAVRDGIRYDPYLDFSSLETYRASSVLKKGFGYCVGKAALFAAACRVIGIPARVGFADVRNHLATPRLLQTLGTDLFIWHGYVECYSDNRWMKVSPTFNLSLCTKLNVAPLEFNGSQNALLQAFDSNNARFMEYVVDRGTFFDVPAKFLISEMRRQYPNLFKPGVVNGRNMEEEAAATLV